MRRFHIDTAQKKDLKLMGKEHNHLAHVLRMKVGDKVILTCNDPYDYLYSIKVISKNETQLEFISKSLNEFNPTTNVNVFMGLIKLDKLQFVVEKLNELGVTNLYLFTSTHSNISSKDISLDKLNSYAIQSSKQCCRSISLRVHPVVSFEEMVVKIKEHDVRLFCSERGGKHIITSLQRLDGMTCLIIGPEGGFSNNEHDILGKTATPVTLSKRILRTETAVIAVTAIVQNHLEEEVQR